MALSRIRRVAEAHGAELTWKPILVGGIFNEVNPNVYGERERLIANERKFRYWLKDMKDWGRLLGIEINWPDGHPFNAVKGMRGAIVAQDEGCLEAYAMRLAHAYWGENRDISEEAVLREVARDAGLDPKIFLQRIEAPDVKDRLIANAAELMDRGGFGSPTIFVNGEDMYFGNDRMPLVEAALARYVEGADREEDE